MSINKKDSDDHLKPSDRPKMKIALCYKPFVPKAFLFLVLIIILSWSSLAHASLLSSIITNVAGTTDTSKAPDMPTPRVVDPVVHNSQNIPLLESSINPDTKNIKDEPPAPASSSATLLSSDGSLSVDYDLEAIVTTEKINTYTVKKGDTLDSISKKLKIPKNTIIASNSDLKKKDLLKIGQELVILSLKDQATKASVGSNANTKGILTNKIEQKTPSKSDALNGNSKSNAKDIAKTEKTVSKDSIKSTPPKTTVVSLPPVISVASPDPVTTPITPEESEPSNPTPTVQPHGNISGGYIWPFAPGVGRVSQGLHADSAYDFSAPIGTPIRAVQSGTVFLVHPTGYNGGYGKYVVINFTDGRQAIFGHMNETNVEEGQTVTQGDIIGYVGMTGKTTGPHVHIGFHGDLGNPYVGLKVNSTDVQNDE